MPPADIPRCYGPNKALQFSGDAESFELWQVKFKAYLRMNKLHKVIEAEVVGDEESNAEVYAVLVQTLDDKSLNLIIRDAPDDGRKAMKILQDYYLGTSKPLIISLYNELTSLKKGCAESVTEYMIRAEKSATRLKQAEEVVSDGLLVAMMMKGLPDSYRSFCTIITRTDSEKMNFQKFKSSLKSYEESEAARSPQVTEGENKNEVYNVSVCYNCGKPGHIKSECYSKSASHSKFGNNKRERWCSNCKSSTHDTNFCRRQAQKPNYSKNNSKVKNAKCENDDYFVFKVTVHHDNISSVNDNSNFLVDCGATTHIINDSDKFVKVDDSFDADCHIIELADCSRQKGILTARGDAKIELKDNKGNLQNVILKNALCIPSYKQNILSVYAMTEKGMKVQFSPESNKIIAPNDVTFDIVKKGKLYYLNNVNDLSISPSLKSMKNASSSPLSKSLEEWQCILGHCNVPDLLNLEKSSIGMKISSKSKFECKVCVEAKMSQQINHKPDAKAKSPLELVHTDLSRPISPSSLQGCSYCIFFVDYFSGLVAVYFLKQKSDALAATEKFIADMSLYER